MGYNLKQNDDGSTSLINELTKTEVLTLTASDGIDMSDASEVVMPDAEVTAGAGITGGTGTVYAADYVRGGSNGITKLKILIDLTGLDSDAALGDIIGVDGTSDACHIGQIPSDIGTVLTGRMTCLEAPATGEVDIDVYSATEGTGVTDGAIGDLTETVALAAAADWTLGAVKVFTGFPPAGSYLYLTVGTSSTPTAGTYTAGKFLIELEAY